MTYKDEQFANMHVKIRWKIKKIKSFKITPFYVKTKLLHSNAKKFSGIHLKKKKKKSDEP
jgi:hypothetical protein